MGQAKEKPDFQLFLLTAVLCAFGLIMVYSASAVLADERYGSSVHYVGRQALWLAVGTIALAAVSRLDLARLRPLAVPALFASLFLALLVCVPGVGRSVGGAQRWFRLGPLSFQPSEALKLAWVVFLADSLARRRDRLGDLKGLAPYVVLLVAAGVLLQLQHDFGSAVMLCVLTAVMLFMAGVRFRYLAVPGLFLLAGLVLLVVVTPYRMRRISAFLHPWDDPLGAGFQLIQSLIAVGSGGPLGVGLSNSTQKLFYLPAPHTDFIFAIVSEELGLWGSTGLVLVFALFTFRGLKVASSAAMKREGLFLGLLAVGLTGLVAFQAFLNLGVVTGLLPTKGLPLPLVSYGGTSLVFTLLAVGLLLNVSRGSRIHGEAYER